MLRAVPHLFLSASLLIAVASGCGDTSSSSVADASADRPEESSVSAPSDGKKAESSSTELSAQSSAAARITASIPNPVAASDFAELKATGAESATAVTDGSSNPVDDAAKILQEIQQLRISAVPADLELARQARRERNERIVEMATNVLRMTMNDTDRTALFNQAIGQLLEARFQMALAGGQEEVDQLYQDVQALNERDPASPAAAEGVYYIARFAHTKAGLLGRTQPEWFSTLSKWAREFADRFPEQQQRAVSMLFGAALSCELHASATTDADLSGRLTTEARLCYTTLAEKFSETSQGQKAAAILRRMSLAGQPLSQFSGPTLDGGFVSVDDFSGKPTVIYFWSSEDKEFAEKWQPLLQKVRSQVPNERLKMIGVALDEIETEMEAFLETRPLPGQQIFFPNPEQRSWNSPLVRFWGITKTPAVWLVDANGVVVSAAVSSEELIPLLQKTLK